MIQAGGKTYRLLRGEFHRHTEISQDGGADGALEDMWRYAIDAAGFDWIGNGDHDNGGGKEYTWWLIQKTTELYHNPPAFVPMFTYERSVSYPHGHRNVMFPRRGVRTLPRLVDDRGVSDRGHEDALRLSSRARRHLRRAHLAPPAWGPTGATTTRPSSRSSRSSRGIATRTSTWEHRAWRDGRARRSAAGSRWA